MSQTILKLVIGLLAILFNACEYAVEDTSKLKITGGTEDKNFPAVAKITGCSGTFVAQNIILTAAHCVIESGTKVKALELISYRGTSSSDSHRIPAQKVIVHPSYDKSSPDRAPYDMALIAFPETVSSDHIMNACSNPPAADTTVDVVGYGLRCTELGGSDCRPTQNRFSGKNHIYKVASNGAILIYKKNNLEPLKEKLSKEDQEKMAHVGPGDSGSPLIHNGCILGTLKGPVDEFGMSNSSDAYYGGYSNLYEHREWLSQTLTELQESME